MTEKASPGLDQPRAVARRRERERRERRAFQRNAPVCQPADPVELASLLSFPASDAPAWIARRPRKK
jgi:hypothetical protein